MPTCMFFLHDSLKLFFFFFFLLMEMHLLKSSPCMSPPSEIKMGYLPIFIPSSNTSSIERKIKVNSDISILQKRIYVNQKPLSMFMSNRVKLWPSQCILHIHQLVYFSTESCCILYSLCSYWDLDVFESKFTHLFLVFQVSEFAWTFPEAVYVI